MKLNGRTAKAFFQKPDTTLAGLLIYGADPVRVAGRRKEVVLSYAGENAEADMRITRIGGDQLRGEPATLLDGLKAQGFFPGERVVIVESATDGGTKAIEAALSEWQPGDAHLVVTAGSLAPRSSLRKFFESSNQVACAAIYDDPPDRTEIENILRKCGLRNVPQQTVAELITLVATMSPSELEQFFEKVALYKHKDAEPLSLDDLWAVAPASIDADLDSAIDVIADGRANEVAPLLKKLRGQGIVSVRLCLMTLQHFRKLHAAATHQDGASIGLSQLRPPVNFKRKEPMMRQLRAWTVPRLERAIKQLVEADLTLRSSAVAPQDAMLERTFLRIAMMVRERR